MAHCHVMDVWMFMGLMHRTSSPQHRSNILPLFFSFSFVLKLPYGSGKVAASRLEIPLKNSLSQVFCFEFDTTIGIWGSTKIKAVERLHANAGRPPLNVASESLGVSICLQLQNGNIFHNKEIGVVLLGYLSLGGI